MTAPSEKMEKIKKNWSSINFAKGTQSIKNSEGFVKVNFNNKIRNFVQNTAGFNRTAQTIHESISLSIEKVNEHFCAAA